MPVDDIGVGRWVCFHPFFDEVIVWNFLGVAFFAVQFTGVFGLMVPDVLPPEEDTFIVREGESHHIFWELRSCDKQEPLVTESNHWSWLLGFRVNDGNIPMG